MTECATHLKAFETGIRMLQNDLPLEDGPKRRMMLAAIDQARAPIGTLTVLQNAPEVQP